MSSRKKASTFSPGNALAARRAGLLLFSGDSDLESHWTRIIAHEKDVDGLAIEWVSPGAGNEDRGGSAPRLQPPPVPG